MTTAVSQMDKVTQANAASAEETASAAEELNAQSEVMRDTVRSLRQLVDGSAQPSTGVPIRPALPKVAPAAPKHSAVPSTLASRLKGAAPAVNGNGNGNHDEFFK